MAQTNLSNGVEMLVARHAATEGCQVGVKALSEVKKYSNVDPSDGIWMVGDQFTIPTKDLLDLVVFVAVINGNKVPAIAVETTKGEPKVLYISTLKKTIYEYEEIGGQYVIKRNPDGSNKPLFADTPLRREVLSKETVGEIIESLAGRTFKVTRVMGPFQTSRLKIKIDSLGRRDGYEIIGLRKTYIPVFEEVV